MLPERLHRIVFPDRQHVWVDGNPRTHSCLCLISDRYATNLLLPSYLPLHNASPGETWESQFLLVQRSAIRTLPLALLSVRATNPSGTNRSRGITRSTTCVARLWVVSRVNAAGRSMSQTWPLEARRETSRSTWSCKSSVQGVDCKPTSNTRPSRRTRESANGGADAAPDASITTSAPSPFMRSRMIHCMSSRLTLIW